MKVEGAKENNEGIDTKNCRIQAAAASTDVIKISRVRFYFREGGRKCSGQNFCSLVWQDIQVLTAKCQVSCISSAELGITRSLFMDSTIRSVKTAQTGKKPQFMPRRIYSLERVHMSALENI